MLSQRSLKWSSFFKIIFFFFLFCFSDFHYSVFQFDDLFLHIILVKLLMYFLFQYCIHQLFLVLLFSNSLLSFSLFIHFSPKFAEHLYDHYVELFMGRFLIFTSLSSSSEVLSCSFLWDIFLCSLILPNSLGLLLYSRWVGYVFWSCLDLCGFMHCSPPGSSVHGIFQARTLE